MEKKPTIQYIAMPEYLRGRYQYYTNADLTRIRRAGYRDSITPLEDAIRDYVRNYLSGSEYLAP